MLSCLTPTGRYSFAPHKMLQEGILRVFLYLACPTLAHLVPPPLHFYLPGYTRNIHSLSVSFSTSWVLPYGPDFQKVGTINESFG